MSEDRPVPPEQRPDDAAEPAPAASASVPSAGLKSALVAGPVMLTLYGGRAEAGKRRRNASANTSAGSH
jgi:hypothetical protein